MSIPDMKGVSETKTPACRRGSLIISKTTVSGKCSGLVLPSLIEPAHKEYVKSHLRVSGNKIGIRE